MKYKFKTKPYAHQLNALKKSWDKKEYAYFMEMGTGKSKVLVDNLSLIHISEPTRQAESRMPSSA